MGTARGVSLGAAGSRMREPHLLIPLPRTPVHVRHRPRAFRGFKIARRRSSPANANVEDGTRLLRRVPVVATELVEQCRCWLCPVRAESAGFADSRVRKGKVTLPLARHGLHLSYSVCRFLRGESTSGPRKNQHLKWGLRPSCY